MTVISVEHDLEALTVGLVAEFTAPVEKVWELWADPRKLEKWWGPPTYPATFTTFELEPGGKVAYYMTSPEGEKYGGWWRVTDVVPPTAISFEDGFSDADGNPVDSMPVSKGSMMLTSTDSGTRMTMSTSYSTREQLEQVLEMGMLEGLRAAVGQMDALLVEA